MQVLGPDHHTCVLKRLLGRRDVHKGNAQQNITPLGFGQHGFQLVGKGLGLGSGLVHLPAACNNCFSISSIHDSIYLFLSFRTGRDRLLRNRFVLSPNRETGGTPPGPRVFQGRTERQHGSPIGSVPLSDPARRPVTNLFYPLSSSAATPGSSFPSINSREAPPPVEIWVI